MLTNLVELGKVRFQFALAILNSAFNGVLLESDKFNRPFSKMAAESQN